MINYILISINLLKSIHGLEEDAMVLKKILQVLWRCIFSYNYLPSLSRKLETLILTGTLGGEKRTGVIETIKRELPKCDVVV